MKTLTKKLQQLKDKHRYRSLTLPAGLDLTSNDYLGMKAHPLLRDAAMHALDQGLDIGAGGSRLLRGHMDAHAALEEFAASHFRHERALYMATGFQANMALFTSLPDRHDVILYDQLVHASARDGIEASKAKSFKFAHNDMDALRTLLDKYAGAQQIWVAVESLYSMDGDRAPLDALYALTDAYGAVLIVDEAHASGVCGDGGRGLAAGLPRANLITLHTCGKAIGVAGGLICAESEMIEMMINAARPFIYSTAPMPLQALLVQKSLEILAGDEGDSRRTRLAQICQTVHDGIGGPGTHIVPYILGADDAALQAANELKGQGFDVRAIRPPTVAEGTARLRISLSSELNHDDISKFLSALDALEMSRKDEAA